MDVQIVTSSSWKEFQTYICKYIAIYYICHVLYFPKLFFGYNVQFFPFLYRFFGNGSTFFSFLPKAGSIIINISLLLSGLCFDFINFINFCCQFQQNPYFPRALFSTITLKASFVLIHLQLSFNSIIIDLSFLQGFLRTNLYCFFFNFKVQNIVNQFLFDYSMTNSILFLNC